MSNRLAKETSPYLLQHAHNPVDWYAWGPEAFERARQDDKPILLSIGYSACHWCHVMERESFEDQDTARLMNELFVNVKVDREERPDVDSIYMQAVQAMTGHGGWPMTTFLTPALVPFWGGTYFPPEDRAGMPSFQRVLRAVAAAYRERRDDVDRVAASMQEMYDTARERAGRTGQITAELLSRAGSALLAQLDRDRGGFGAASKFPQAMALEFLLQRWARAGDDDALHAVQLSFGRMWRGGIYDQIGGGFARYSVDANWLVPHFEKMLYDNALLARLSVHLWQATHDPDARRVAEETFDWLGHEMTSPTGGFYSTLDADSEGEEGRFYLWDERELRDLLGDDADALMTHWGASTAGNFEGRNILNVQDGTAPDAAVIARARRTLYDARAARVWPARDEKIIASWNGLMLRAIAEGARAFGESRFHDLAVRNGTFLFDALVRDDRVLRTHKDGTSRIPGFLEDYAAIGLGALALYELTFDRIWLDRAHGLAVAATRRFWDEAAGMFFDTSADHDELPTRPRDVTDNATPSGTSLVTELLLRLGDVLGDAELRRRGTHVLETLAEPMARYPLAFGHALSAADLVAYGAVELALVGARGSAGFIALERAAATRYVPSLVLAGGHAADGVALLRDRAPERDDGRATAYVCRGYVCDEPTEDAERLGAQLERAARGV